MVDRLFYHRFFCLGVLQVVVLIQIQQPFKQQMIISLILLSQTLLFSPFLGVTLTFDLKKKHSENEYNQ